MTLGENKKITLALIEEYSPNHQSNTEFSIFNSLSRNGSTQKDIKNKNIERNKW